MLDRITVLDKIAIGTLCALMIGIGLFPVHHGANGADRCGTHTASCWERADVHRLAFKSILPEAPDLLPWPWLLLAIEPFWKQERRRNLGWITAGGLCDHPAVALSPSGRRVRHHARSGRRSASTGWASSSSCSSSSAPRITALLLMDHEKRRQPRRSLRADAGLHHRHVPDGVRRGPGDAVPGHRDDLHPALRPGRLHADR